MVWRGRSVPVTVRSFCEPSQMKSCVRWIFLSELLFTLPAVKNNTEQTRTIALMFQHFILKESFLFLRLSQRQCMCLTFYFTNVVPIPEVTWFQGCVCFLNEQSKGRERESNATVVTSLPPTVLRQVSSVEKCTSALSPCFLSDFHNLYFPCTCVLLPKTRPVSSCFILRYRVPFLFAQLQHNSQVLFRFLS